MNSQSAQFNKKDRNRGKGRREVPRKSYFRKSSQGKPFLDRWELDRNLNEFIMLKRRGEEKESYFFKDESKYVNFIHVNIKSFIFLRKLRFRTWHFNSLILLDTYLMSHTVLGTGVAKMNKVWETFNIMPHKWTYLMEHGPSWHRSNSEREPVTHQWVSGSLWHIQGTTHSGCFLFSTSFYLNFDFYLHILESWF